MEMYLIGLVIGLIIGFAVVVAAIRFYRRWKRAIS